MNLRPPPMVNNLMELRKWCDDLYRFLQYPVFPGGAVFGSQTDYTKISNTGVLNKSGIWHAYGGFQNKTQVINVIGANQWAWITNAGNNLWTGLEADGISLTGDIMTITNAGDYFGSLSITFSGLTGKDFQIRLFNITTSTVQGYVIGASTTGANNFTNINLPLYIESAAGDTFRMEITCNTDGTDPILRSAVFYLAYLHD